MPPEIGGGFALAVGSHTAKWRNEAYLAIGASALLPEGGYQNASDMLERRGGAGTCNLKDASPHLHQRMEDTKRIYDIKRGDVIFHTRWLFHRTVAFNRSRLKHEEDPIFRRYSIRYGPGFSVIPPGFSTEVSVLWDNANAGRTADEVSTLDGPWYPRVWPSVIAEETAELSNLAKTKLNLAEDKRQALMKEMGPLIKRKIKQNRPTHHLTSEHAYL